MKNDIGWILGGVGVASFVASIFLSPRLSPADMDAENKKKNATKANLRLDLSPAGRATFRLSF